MRREVKVVQGTGREAWGLGMMEEGKRTHACDFQKANIIGGGRLVG